MIIAVIVHYWQSRRTYLSKIVDALMSGSIVPNHIVIWNNSSDHLQIEKCLIINAQNNYGSFARYAAALVMANFVRNGGMSAHILMQDDDLMVGYEAVQNLVEQCREEHDLVAASGKTINRDSTRPYFDGKRILSGRADVVGALMACKAIIIAEMMAFAARNRLSVYREDDLLLSISNLVHGGKNSVVPVDYKSLDDRIEGLCRQPQHYAERDFSV